MFAYKSNPQLMLHFLSIWLLIYTVQTIGMLYHGATLFFLHNVTSWVGLTLAQVIITPE